MLSDHGMEGLTMVTNKVQGTWKKPLQGREQFSSKQTKEGLWCSYCKKPTHTRDTCFKLHGKETIPSKLRDFKNLQLKNQGRAYLSTKETVELYNYSLGLIL